ncbi:bifunctional 4-hydroxy-2-oxoglutarate aldolase/2-dehydro-3-deoxy-phosphogluconate aldolase [Marinospirillum alkaliphilum]|uniref:2-dehydro-3-deoxyphosphogluconate aldolase / (4S)-4-hydroxy-2-oxoglutarate aldolase n=1 Tax=Marinospirillum alkaliphilum DSM 21637 TaxID=1122209 RepID=A0A1K1UDV4_9GAMM|nr:bifunctional 4-hydroxy-2-oxoglutarate aldolase/2-dehydro-3-deoxy-phosphogluconate aldolase [Marinospirillum alkaliphilum]SFX10780.1 2-dehydro-3-deoxyphosphogluconate aldolase / (4S)-4-hydroxy-2-oxoglutarate aldolase [Marinospirillum alkaliphilum DSM 21637]
MSHVSPFDWSSLLKEQPLVPVWASVVPEAAAQVAQTLLKAGYGVLEVTLREEGAWWVLETLRATELTLVAGSLRHPEQLKRLQECGISMAVTPGWCPELCEAAKQLGIRLLPGVSTPGEAMQASLMGYRQVKLFPAMALGGPAYLRAMRAPLPELEFVPTGGIDESSMAQWFALPGVVALGGSWMLPKELVVREDWSILEHIASRSLAAARELRQQRDAALNH